MSNFKVSDKIIIIGPGQIGMFFASIFTNSELGNKKLMVTVKARSNYEVIRKKGIKFQLGGKTFVSNPSVTNTLSTLGSDPRIVVITTKAYDLPNVLQELDQLHTNCQAFFLPINGIRTEDDAMERLIAAKFSGVPIISGSVTLPVEKTDINAAKVTNPKGGIALAKFNDILGSKEVLDFLYRTFISFDINSMICSSYEAMCWSKMLLNMIANALCAITNLSAKEIFQDQLGAWIERGCLREFLLVLDKKGIKLIDLPGYSAKTLNLVRQLCAWYVPLQAFQWVMINQVTKARGGKTPGLHADLLFGAKTTEIFVYNGGIARAAKKVNIKTPFNSAVVTVLESVSYDYGNNEFRGIGGLQKLAARIRSAM